MKRTLTLLAILAAIGPAWAADVVSSNIVGYNKVTLTPATANSVGYTIVGVSFQEVGGDSLDINDILGEEFKQNLVGGYGTTDSDTIQVWNGTGYTFYYFSADDWSEEAGDGTVDAYKNSKWLTLSDEPVATPINLCAGFWFKRNGSTDLTLTLP